LRSTSVRLFRQQKHDASRSVATGKILFTNSVHQIIPWAGRANYAASKGGLKLLMETMAQELAAEKIRVNAIAPGAIKIDINTKAWGTTLYIDGGMLLYPAFREGG
jgi:glucose 1-dehydrogenase